MNIVALIPARGGSKGIKNKNIVSLLGKPLISYTILTARKVNQINDIFVSTDSPAIKKISEKYGAKAPFLRPKKLSTSKAKIIDAFIFTINRLRKEYDINHFISLAPTSPLTEVKDINKSIELYFQKKAKSLISVVKNNKPFEWFLEKKRNNKIKPFVNKNLRANRQQGKQLYIPNGSIYIFNYTHLIKNNSYFNNLTYSYEMPKSKSIDIDDKIDFQIAEYLFRKKFR